MSGLGTVSDPIYYIPPHLQLIVPSLQFRESGHITAVHLAGICSGGTTDIGSNVSCISIVQVWRPTGGDGYRFSMAANFTATLTVPFAVPVTASVTVDEPMLFSSGDVLGFTPGPTTGNFFQIATTSTAGSTHTHYTFGSYSPELMTASNNRVSASPVISVEGMYTVYSELILVVQCV